LNKDKRKLSSLKNKKCSRNKSKINCLNLKERRRHPNVASKFWNEWKPKNNKNKTKSKRFYRKRKEFVQKVRPPSKPKYLELEENFKK